MSAVPLPYSFKNQNSEQLVQHELQNASSIVNDTKEISKSAHNHTYYGVLKDTSIIDDFIKHKNNQKKDNSENCWDGIHTKHYKNGNIYTGNFLNGQRSGQGKEVQKDGTIFEGQWLKDNKI